VIKELISRYNIEAIAIGNGTASRETESFVRSLGLDNIQVIMVNEPVLLFIQPGQQEKNFLIMILQ
jgi:transcriptional accessory protein Tex/SPT6